MAKRMQSPPEHGPATPISTITSPVDGVSSDQINIVQLREVVKAVDLIARRQCEICNRLSQRIDALQQLKMFTTESENTLLRSLGESLNRARILVSNLQDAKVATDVIAILAKLSDTLADSAWEAARDTLDALDKKIQQQDEAVEQYRTALETYNSRINNLSQAVYRGRRASVSVRRGEHLLLRLEASFRLAERILRGELPFIELNDPIKVLDEETKDLDHEIEQIDATIQELEPFSHEAGLTILRSDADERIGLVHQYNFLCGMPLVESFSLDQGLYGSTYLTKQDRDQITQALANITTTVYHRGLARQPNQQAENHLTELPNITREQALRHLYLVNADITDKWPVDLGTMVALTGELISRLLLPQHIEERLTHSHCSLSIATNDFEIPWEFMCIRQQHNQTTDTRSENFMQGPPSSYGFLCLQRPVSRIPVVRGSAIEPRFHLMPPKRRFLLISDPNQNLPNAKREVATITEMLMREWPDQVEVTVLDGVYATGQSLNHALLAGEYEVIHYAGHAFFNSDRPDQSALILHDQEPFFASKIRRLLTGRPLVFLNTCESGTTANEAFDRENLLPDSTKLFAGLSSYFAYAGALACIGPLWPIYDQSAASFAIAFYKYLLEGHMIGEAMRRTRCQIKAQYPNEITWASYALFGDPVFRFVE